MLKALTHDISNKRFLVYVVLLYVLAMTAGAWVPASSPIFDGASYIKLLLIPFAQTFLMKGARHRWPDHYFVISMSATLFYAGLIISTAVLGNF